MTDISSETMSVGFRYMRLLRRQTMAIQKKDDVGRLPLHAAFA